ncbi:MAG TPA: FAD:protein FMN transferase [Povalibacter sp.]|nr:FAD:protein FMN transferase [Povalibacter sp.]
MHRKKIASSLIVIAAACVSLVACSPPPPAGSPEIALSGPTMGTTYSVKVASPPAGIDSNAVRVAIDDVLARIDLDMSGYRDDSTVSRFNASTSTDWFAVSEDLAKVVSESLQVSELSQGALDITVAPLVNLWGMGPAGEQAQLPSDAEIQRALARTGYRKLQVRMSPAALRKEIPELTIDLNAVAPGYAVDLLASRFASMDIGNFMIDIGGEVRARGLNGKGQVWRIAVERPIDAEEEPYAVVRLDDLSVTTSGEYRHYIVRDGHRYSHTIDPRTGRPVEHDLASVVVATGTALQADAWATALNVLGAEAGYALARERNMAAMFIVASGGELHDEMTEAFRRLVIAE